MIGGVHLSAGREERAKVARLEASSCGGGGNSARRHQRAGQLCRPRGRGPVGRGGATGWKEEKKNGLRLGRKDVWAESDGKIIFRIKFDF
jgi:hypothetical protein